ncbi:transmembrane protein 223 isoform X2 [Diaphorina citri]|uniref:Transmembrane protein 223 isoform X2 n=1 Tax=Diaphorina citri TaxID=121845 RepID=A0A1S3DBY4_DIACI|nr:transmembrane protein 223 isoform X2 [Diaphorina citri]
MSMFNILKQVVNLNKVQLCQKSFQVNSKSFAQYSYRLNSSYILNNSSAKTILKNKIPFSKNIISRFITNKVDTNVTKEVILYNYINSRHTNIILLFGLSQSFFWYYLGYIIMTELRDIPIDENSPEEKNFFTKHNFGENKWKYSMGTVCFLLGTLAVALSVAYNIRIITTVKLDKAGKTITLLVAEDRLWKQKLVVPLKNVSAIYARSEMKSFFPIRVKDRSIYFMDMEGPITNEVLFDVTVGTRRDVNGIAK